MVHRFSKPSRVAALITGMDRGNHFSTVLIISGKITACLLIGLLAGAFLTGCQSSTDEQYQSYAEAAKPQRKTPPPAATEDISQPTVQEVVPVKPKPVIVPVVAIKPQVVAKPAALEIKQTFRVLVPTRKFRKEGDYGLRISYDDLDLLKVLNMNEVKPGAEKYFPEWLKQLDGKRVVLRGFMYPPYSETGIKRFALARDNEICCFGRKPKIYDKFLVTLKSGVTTNYIANRPFDVAGTFYIDPFEEEGELLQLYEIRDAVVIDK